MKITEIIKEDFSVYGDFDKDISGIAFDSRDIRCGELFVALKGENFDGHDFILDAIKRGASAVVYERNEDRENELEILRNRYPEIVWICVDDTRDALAAISNNFYKRPSEDAVLIGITGTNGKTTTSYLIKSIIEMYGAKVGLIGTIKYLINDKAYNAIHTTPEAVQFQSLLRMMVEDGCNYIVTEVSSHALSQKRVDYSRFKVAVFTNLTRDHLDFHKTMEAYFKAKERLFTELLTDNGIAVINIDEPYGERILNALKGHNKRILTYGINNKNADIIACDIDTTFNGVSFILKTMDSSFKIESPLIGIVNVYNILAASGVALSLGIPVEFIVSTIRSVKTISGRFESIQLGQKFLAIVDYAHTEDALERLLVTARHLLNVRKSKDSSLSSGGGRIITVFGCGGNRDRGKRPIMGDIATSLSDFVILTSDNPRNEDPARIIRDIEAGIKKENYLVMHDRVMAINMAVEIAASNDIVIIAGKGHEEYQEVKGIRHHFSDKEVLENAIKRKTGKPLSGNIYRAVERFK